MQEIVFVRQEEGGVDSRMGYFIADQKDSKPGSPIFNCTTPLCDIWAKVQKEG